MTLLEELDKDTVVATYYVIINTCGNDLYTNMDYLYRNFYLNTMYIDDSYLVDYADYRL